MKLLCVGGPAAGRKIDVKDPHHNQTCYVMIHEKIKSPFVLDEKDDPGQDSFRNELYRVVEIRHSPADANSPTFFLRWHEQGIGYALALLLDSYRQPLAEG